MFQRILVATDGATLSKKAVNSAIELATHTQGSLVVVQVVPRYLQGLFESGVALATDEVAQIERQAHDSAQAVVDKVRQAAEARGVPTKAVVLKAHTVSEGLLAAAKKHKCDLIVMASHGRRGLKRLLLGSETQQVLTHAHLPVLVLR